MKKSFSLLGVLISSEILTVAAVAIIGLMASSIIYAKTSGNKLVALGLAQEGIEITRNIRDRNWLAGGSLAWRDGLADGAYQAKLNPLGLIGLTAENKKMRYGTDFWYVPAEPSVLGADTIFERIITISTGTEGEIIAECETSWSERGKNFSIVLEDKLYNWR